MYANINRRLVEAQEGIFQLHRLDSMLKHLHQERHALTSKVRELKSKLEKEKMDVSKLEKKSLSVLFYSVLGNLEQRLEKERQEALAAKLKFGQAQRDLDDVTAEILRLSAQREQYIHCQHEYDRLYLEKQQMLMDSGSQEAQELMDCVEKLNARKSLLKEIREAVSAGRGVIKCLDSAFESLGSAKSWGVWDIWGGGLLADLAKHSHIDDAQDSVQRAQVLLRRFNTELADVRTFGHMAFETGGFAKFADFFFDGLIADYVMQSKIKNSQDSVVEVRSQVIAVLSKLTEMEACEIKALAQLEERVNALVIES
ncbi:MAG TPA: hypothetical protein DG577_04630 [Firmicutes bacterium]|nr:hypothetical protein [Bacillota bacterium]HCX78676.1 hypothetical protein [Bacillota bacterium]